jgi:hypothetical protein
MRYAIRKVSLDWTPIREWCNENEKVIVVVSWFVEIVILVWIAIK